MKKTGIALLIIAASFSARAEWYTIKSVDAYNMVTAYKANDSSNAIKIRIENLENIEDIRSNPRKVLLSGQPAIRLAKDALEGQLVWIENLKEHSGVYVGNIFLSYEQVVRSFAKQRMVGGQTIAPDVLSQVQDIYRKMINQMNSAPVSENIAALIDANKKAAEGRMVYSLDSCYSDSYMKVIFTYESLKWFKEQGQFLSPDAQKLFISWLSSYQNAQSSSAKDLEQRMRDFTVRSSLYRDFLYED